MDSEIKNFNSIIFHHTLPLPTISTTKPTTQAIRDSAIWAAMGRLL